MKKSIRLPFSLLLVTFLFLFLSYRTTSSRCSNSILNPVIPRQDFLNETLLRLAEIDPSEEIVKNDVNTLLGGNLPKSASRRYFTWRRDSRRSNLPISNSQFIFPKDLLSLPQFQDTLYNWFKFRFFQPEIISKLPELTTQRRYKSCAVVGNSGILLKSENGDLIDSHELVIRLNNARISGYRRHVGSKTNFSFINSNILHLCSRRKGCFCHPYGENTPIIMYMCQAVHFLDLTVCNDSNRAPIHVTDPRFDRLCSRIVKLYSLKRFVRITGKEAQEWGKKHDELMFHYSSGFQAVMLAVGICDEVSVFGFGKSKEAKHHYHTNQKTELDLHDYEAEYEFYKDLVERPNVIPFLTDNGFTVPPVKFYH
ncbi:hypothetical protein LUZ60_001759 [Juncus effusus]|nr:hypothetical protein LUZ60_001759 [Juncus effusus]